MGWKRILSQKRPAAGGGLTSEILFYIKIGGEGWILHKVEGGFCIFGEKR